MFKGDNTQAFGNKFLEIEIDSVYDLTGCKAVFQCGSIQKEITNLTSPIIVNLTSEETKKLQNQNVCYLALFDKENRKMTCEGSLFFNVKDEVVSG